MENEIAYNPNIVSAVDYSSRYVNVRGEKLGLLTDVNKSPLQSLGLTGLNILSGDRTYIAYYNNSTNLSLSGQSLISILSLGNKNTAQYDTGLVGYWDMETTTNSGGNIFLKDLSKYGNNGNCYNTGTLVSCGGLNGGPQFVEGNRGKAMQFDGKNTYINITSGTSILDRGSGVFTINAITKIRNTSLNGGTIVRIGIGCYTPGYRLDLWTDSTFSFRNWDGINGGIESKVISNIVSANNWYNMTVSSNGQSFRFFINGLFIGATTYSQIFSPVSGMSLDIGASKGICPKYGALFNGVIDDIRIYNRALSDDEVKALYNATN